MTPARFAYFMIVVTTLALVVVWQSTVQRKLGYEMEGLTARLAQADADRVVYQAHLSKLRNPERIVDLVKWLGLDLKPREIASPDTPAAPATADAPAEAPAPKSAAPAPDIKPILRPVAAANAPGRPAATRKH